MKRTQPKESIAGALQGNMLRNNGQDVRGDYWRSLVFFNHDMAAKSIHHLQGSICGITLCEVMNTDYDAIRQYAAESLRVHLGVREHTWTVKVPSMQLELDDFDFDFIEAEFRKELQLCDSTGDSARMAWGLRNTEIRQCLNGAPHQFIADVRDRGEQSKFCNSKCRIEHNNYRRKLKQ